MRWRSISLAIICLLSGALASAAALDCRVVGSSGLPLSGARVSVIGRPGSIVADMNGDFELEPVPELPFTIIVARPDGVAISPVTIAVVPESGPLEITVEPASDTVTVVMDVVPDLEVPPAVSSTVIGRADLDQRQPQRISDVLESTPGAGRTGEGHSVVPGLRGLPKHRTLILLDDGRVTAERRAGPSATFLNPESVDEIEVIRGPGCVAYGSDAFGGIIRARSRMPDPRGETRARYSLLLGSAADEYGGSAEVTTALLGGGALIGAHYRDYGNYSSPEGEVLDSAAEERAFRLAYQAVVGNGVLHVGWRTDQARDVGKPAPDSRTKRTFYPREDSNRFNLGYERPGPGSWNRFAFSLAWDSYRLVLDKDTFATAGDPRSISRADVDANDYELRVEAERPLGAARLVVGANAYGRYDLHAINQTLGFAMDGSATGIDTEISVDNARRDDLGLFVGLGRDLGRWDLAAGLRGDRVTTKNRGGYFGNLSTSSSDVSGFLAVGFDLSKHLKLTAQVAHGFRDALLSDRYYRGVTGRGFITGNPDLEPETAMQYDLALRFDPGRRLKLSAFGYLYRIDDLIERYKEDGSYFFRNRGEAEIKGIELEASLVLLESLTLQAGAHYLRGEVLDDGSPTDDVPAPGLFVALRGEPGEHWWWMARCAGYLEDDRPGPSEQLVPSYAVFDAALGWRFSAALELQLLGRNLFDRSYLGSADEEAVLAPGRGLQLSLRGRI